MCFLLVSHKTWTLPNCIYILDLIDGREPCFDTKVSSFAVSLLDLLWFLSLNLHTTDNIYSIKIYTKASAFLFHLHRQSRASFKLGNFLTSVPNTIRRVLCNECWVNDCKYESVPQINNNQLASLYIWYTMINAQN